MPAPEVWVRSNRRVLGLAMVAPAGLEAIGAGVIAAADGGIARAIGWGLVGAGAVMLAGLAVQFVKPRVAFRDGAVLFFLRPGPPIAVPAEAVEAFFLGQGPAHLPGAEEGQLEARNLVARISQKHPEWEHIAVKPALGRWFEHYVTMNGPWCEPLDNELIRRLNHRLRQVHDAGKQPAVNQETTT